MPRLGGHDDNDHHSNNPSSSNSSNNNNNVNPYRQRVSTVYSKLRSLKTTHVIFLLLLTFVLRNLLFRDYRKEEMDALKKTGMSFEEIDRFVPNSAEERKKYAEAKSNNEAQMKDDIAFLLQAVKHLKNRLNEVEEKLDHEADPFLEMDNLHQRRRREREEKMNIPEDREHNQRLRQQQMHREAQQQHFGGHGDNDNNNNIFDHGNHHAPHFNSEAGNMKHGIGGV